MSNAKTTKVNKKNDRLRIQRVITVYFNESDSFNKCKFLDFTLFYYRAILGTTC